MMYIKSLKKKRIVSKTKYKLEIYVGVYTYIHFREVKNYKDYQ